MKSYDAIISMPEESSCKYNLKCVLYIGGYVTSVNCCEVFIYIGNLQKYLHLL